MKKIRQTKLMRIDGNLAKQIEDLAEKNQINMTEASREISKISERLRNRKVWREIRI